MQKPLIFKFIFIATVMIVMQSGVVLAQSVSDIPATSIVDNRPLVARIIGGANAEEDAYPSVVALVRNGTSALNDRLFCGGTAVSERWIMTAAHCVHTSSNRVMSVASVRVVAGINDLVLDTPEREFEVAQIIIHPGYDLSADLPPNDIALLELVDSLDVPSVSLFVGNTDDYVGQMGVIAGWGATEVTEDNFYIYPTALQDASVPLVTDDQCNAPESYDGLIQESHLCAGFRAGEVDACVGDSGGPLFLNVEGTRVQAGITSFGAGCGLPFFYGIYTEIPHFISWLGRYIDLPDETLQLAELAMIDNEEESAGESGMEVVEMEVAGGSAGDDLSDDDELSGGYAGPPALLILLILCLFRHTPCGCTKSNRPESRT